MACSRLCAVRSTLLILVVLSTLLTARPVSTQAPETGSRVDVLINFVGPPGPADLAAVAAAGGRVRFVYSIVPAVAASVPAAAVAALAAHPRIRFIEPDAEVVALDTELEAAWGVHRIGAGIAHQAGIVGAGVKVAVLDTGIDYTHPDLAANYAGGWDFVNNDADPMDDCGHGTVVAGSLAATADGAGVVGVAPAVRLYALKVMGPTSGPRCAGAWSVILAGIDWAAQHGMQITNNSYGGTVPSATAAQAYANAMARGVLHVAAAMNEGNCDGTGDTVGFPAGYRSVIAVANITAADERNCTSSTGPAVEMAAPGTQIFTTASGGGYRFANGTSLASPHVAGVAALLAGAGVADANGNGRVDDEIRNAIAASAIDLGVPGRDPHFGFGRVDVPRALNAVAAPSSLVASVEAIRFTPSGNGKNPKDLSVTVETVYGLAAPTPATVSLAIYRNSVLQSTATIATDQTGAGSTLLRNARAGSYRAEVTSMYAGVLTWDGVTPPNAFVK